MTLTIERSHLVSALQAVTKVVENRNTVPVLANVLLAATDGQLSVRATDLEIDASATVPAQGSLPITTAPARQFLDVVKRLPSGSEVTLDIDGEHLVVKAGRSRSKLSTLPADKFPDIREATYTTEFEADLSALLAVVSFAAAENDAREMLNGVHIRGDANGAHVVATNGYKLSCIAVGGLPEIPSVILPRKLIGVVPQGVVKVSVGETRVRIEQGNVTIVSKLIELAYPDYERVIPRQDTLGIRTTTDRKELLASVERVGVFANERTGKAVRLSFAADGLTVLATGPDGEARDELVATLQGDEISAAFPSDSLSAMLRVVPGDNVSIAFSDAASPTLFTGDDAAFRGVLVPMRI